MAEQALQDLAWGAAWVIIEARESGKGIGIYDSHGAVHTEEVALIHERMGVQIERLIWEAPLKNQQTYLIEQFGPNVSLGNIPTGEVLALEALRTGLRFETFARIAANLARSGEWNPAQIEEPLKAEF
jgi:phosphosulfolactate synthase